MPDDRDYSAFLAQANVDHLIAISSYESTIRHTSALLLERLEDAGLGFDTAYDLYCEIVGSLPWCVPFVQQLNALIDTGPFE